MLQIVRKSAKTVLLLGFGVFILAGHITFTWYCEGNESSFSEIVIYQWNDSNASESFRMLKQNVIVTTVPYIATISRPRRRQKLTKNALQRCPKSGKNLVGELVVDTTVPISEDVEKDWHKRGWVTKGGTWRPKQCQGTKVALIVPYRKRYEHLQIFLHHIHPILKRQLLDYRIFIIEQNGQSPFNRAMLFNIGYNESLKFNNFNCFIFHDVDLMPENDQNYYGCPTSPRHMSVAVDKFNYRLPYSTLLGGVAAFRRKHFEKINGFSNRYWGWGGEDDDLYHRITKEDLNLTRPSAKKGRYQMLTKFHRSAESNPERHNKLLNSQRRMNVDGLNTLNYHIIQTVEHALYTMITVDIQPNLYNILR